MDLLLFHRTKPYFPKLSEGQGLSQPKHALTSSQMRGKHSRLHEIQHMDVPTTLKVMITHLSDVR
jgi:hypothetical protein